MLDFMEIDQVHDKESFLVFLNNLAKDYEEKPEEWRNRQVSDYLECIAAWIKDWGDKNGPSEFDHLDFHEMAEIFYVGKIYE